MSPPLRSVGRAEIHEAIRRAADELIRLFDASEDAVSDEERERADKELYDFALALLADVAGPAIGRVLERERGCPLPGEADTAIQRDEETETAVQDLWRANLNGVRKALARLLLDLKPALGTFPTEPVVRDLLAPITHQASPLILTEPIRTRGKRDRGDLRKEARKRLVYAVYFYAGQTGQSISAARDSVTCGDIIKRTWKELVRDIPMECRRSVRSAGKAQCAAEREGRSYTLSDPAAVQADADLRDGLRDVIDLAVTVQ